MHVQCVQHVICIHIDHTDNEQTENKMETIHFDFYEHCARARTERKEENKKQILYYT